MPTSLGEFVMALRNFLALTVRTLGVAGSRDGNERPKPVIWARELRKEGGRAAAGVDSRSGGVGADDGGVEVAVWA